jgi:alpha-beta hydrolase superfamily lysophospholipase
MNSLTAFGGVFLLVAATELSVEAAGRVVGFAAPDGTPLAGMLYEAPERPAPAVVLVHMLGRSKDEWAPFANRLQEAGATVLALDLRGHGSSGGNGAMLTAMVSDVRAAVEWLAMRPDVRGGGLAIVGASLGANLAASAAAGAPNVRAVALLSPSLDYRGVRIDSGIVKKLGERALWLACSTADPYALRTVKELATGSGPREQRLSGTRAHGTQLLSADPDVAAALVDWLERTLIF